MNTDGDTGRLRWDSIYREAELYKTAVRLYTKPLFNSRKALGCSTDGQPLFDFARRGLKNLDLLHRALVGRRFRFRPALALKRNFNRKDRWLAEEVLSLAFEGGRKRSYFRRLPFRRLRQMGLPSLVHRRRLIVHGQIDSPFFVWREYRSIQGRGERAARPKPPEASAFSQDPEAVAKTKTS